MINIKQKKILLTYQIIILNIYYLKIMAHVQLEQEKNHKDFLKK